MIYPHSGPVMPLKMRYFVRDTLYFHHLFCGAAQRLDFENRASYCAGHFGGKKGLFFTLIEPQ